LQSGYFKAKQAFFRFDWSEVDNDCAFVLSRYFIGAERYASGHGPAHERKTGKQTGLALAGG
jgi:hypothetical protein